MYIAVCDDQTEELKDLTELLGAWETDRGTPVRVKSFRSAAELLDAAAALENRYDFENRGIMLLRIEDKLQLAVSQLLSVDGEAVKQGIGRLLEADRLVRSTLAGITVDYLPRLYEAEVNCSRRLLEFAKGSFPPPKGLERMIQNVAEESGIEYSEEQTRAIREAATSGLLLITGGPGTGKTTILNGILSLLGQMQLACLLAAPTGRAAKRLTEVTGENASTIHRLLEAGIDPGTGDMVFVRDEDNPLKCDAVIVDEMSMVDVELLHHLLQAIPRGKRLILVGDPDQLPPVGPGFPFNDMLRSGCLPTVRLTEIFRQAQQSLIVMNAHRVNQGQMPELKNVKSDFFFLRRQSEDAVSTLIRELCTTRLPKNMGIPPEQIQVLSPTRKGGVGTAALNKMLQAALNPATPDKKERAFGAFANSSRSKEIVSSESLRSIVGRGSGCPAASL